ncbi:hypothetical protein [Lutispora sp.]|uniref:hypothetical protein n=1 Tax=Lutispora sp. TaxID=2828727 RepID=UPI002B1FB461|nr:hypothetical protein [Lutispora sp.]MEA4963855.1 hypothetical protein [Lutispora sp.]
MPEIIIKQNHNISNYIIRLPYLAALNNHTINIISGMIIANRSTGSRFLSEYKWSNKYVDYRTIYNFINIVRFTAHI